MEKGSKRAGKMLLLIILSALMIFAVIFYATHHAENGSFKETPKVRLNEVMLSNKGAVPDEYGDYPDYVEICNASGEDFDLSGCGLSDDLLSGAKYVFPQGTVLKSGGFALVYCAGEAKDEFHASFKLSVSDELVFYETNGNVLESMALSAVSAGHSLSLDEAGQWVDMAPSPGYPNTPEGIEAYAQSLRESEDIGLHINEFMASNRSVCMDMNGLYSDWIELYNSTGADIDVSGFGISDSLAQPMKYALPEGSVVPANGYLLLWCSGNQTDAGELHVPFGLRAYEEDVVLASRTGRVLDSVSYARQEADMSMARVPDGTGEFVQTARPTPGYPNTDAGYAQFVEGNKMQLGTLYFSEMMGRNATALAVDKTYPDWAELFNAGTAVVNLSGYAVSNSINNPAKWVFPEVSIEPGERLLLYATGEGVSAASPRFDASSVQKKNLALNFSISTTGETLYLFDPEGRLLDKLSSNAFPADVSCGRAPDGALRYYTSATPGAENPQEGYLGITASPSFSVSPACTTRRRA